MDNLDALLEQLKHGTDVLLADLSVKSYEELEQFVELRGSLIERILAYTAQIAPTEQQKATVSTILAADDMIINRMLHLRDEAAKENVRLTTAKQQRRAYDFEQSVDSVFFDRKK